MAIEYFCCFHSYRKKIAKLSDQEVGRLFRSLLLYSETGEAPELTGRESVAFDFIADDIDRSKEAYEARCAQNKANRNGRRPSTIVDDGRRQSTIEHKTETKSKTKSKPEPNTTPPDGGSSQGAKAPNARARFTPPTVEEVRTYCTERGNHVNPERFVDFYASKGWKVGNQGMKDWRAAVRTWERSVDQQTSGSSKKGAATAYTAPSGEGDLDLLEAMIFERAGR